jgi:hypothetical protein
VASASVIVENWFGFKLPALLIRVALLSQHRTHAVQGTKPLRMKFKVSPAWQLQRHTVQSARLSLAAVLHMAQLLANTAYSLRHLHCLFVLEAVAQQACHKLNYYCWGSLPFSL